MRAVRGYEIQALALVPMADGTVDGGWKTACHDDLRVLV
jgi:hypothetical protein